MEKATDLENMKIMEDTYSKHPFPQDMSSTAFSSTSIYFKPMDTAAVQVRSATRTKPLEASQSTTTTTTTTTDKPAETVHSAPDNSPSNLSDSPVTSSTKVASLTSGTSEREPEPSQGSPMEASKDRKIHQAASDTAGETDSQKFPSVSISTQEMDNDDTKTKMNNRTTYKGSYSQ